MPDDNDAVEGFPVGAPDIRLGGLQSIRSMIRQDPNRAEKDATADAEEQRIDWHIYGVPAFADTEPLILFGELEVTHGRWFAGTTVFSPVTVRSDDVLKVVDDETAEAAAQALGPWSSDVLYDFAATILRPLIAVTYGCPLELPDRTPDVHIASMRRDDPPTD